MSKATAYFFVLMTIALTVYGQFAIKLKISTVPPTGTGLMDRLGYVVQLYFSPLILSALVAAVLASACWMAAVSRLPLSHAYPMMAATFVAVTVLGHFYFGEHVSLRQVVGLCLIVAGIALGAKG